MGPSHPCCNSRSSPTYPSPLERKRESPAHIQRSPVFASCSRGGILYLRGRERITGVPFASQEEALSTGKARGTPGSCHHSQSPPNISVHSRETCFPCTASTFKPRINSHHGGTLDSPVGKPRGKASCESLMGKPRGKATETLIHAKGSATLLLQLGRKAHVHGPTRDEN